MFKTSERELCSREIKHYGQFLIPRIVKFVTSKLFPLTPQEINLEELQKGDKEIKEVLEDFSKICK